MIWKVIRVIVISTLLTIITQVGGPIYLLSLDFIRSSTKLHPRQSHAVFS